MARIRVQDSASPHLALFDVIDAITASDESKVTVRLKTPFPQLPALLAHPAIAALPFHLIDKQGDDWTASRPMVSSGPYRLTEWKLNQFIKLSANPNWAGGKPATPSIIWQPMDNKQSGMRSMLSGAADTSSDFPDNRLGWLRAKYPKLVRSNGYLATYYFAFNTRRPPFNDVRVRRALAMAVDRKWMTDKMIAAGNAPAWGLLPPGLRNEKAYYPDWAAQPRAQRLIAAKALLRDAGYGPMGNVSATSESTAPLEWSNGVTDNQNAVSRMPVTQLGQDDFLKLLVTQMTTQNPLKPMEDLQSFAQMASFSALEQNKALFKEMSNMRGDLKQLQASSMIGADVAVENKDGLVTSGRVTAMSLTTGKPQLIVNGELYDLEQVLTVRPAAVQP